MVRVCAELLAECLGCVPGWGRVVFSGGVKAEPLVTPAEAAAAASYLAWGCPPTCIVRWRGGSSPELLLLVAVSAAADD